MSDHDFETHRCEGLLAARCSVRRAKHRKLVPLIDAWMQRDGMWHLYVQEYDFDYDLTYMSEVAAIRHCPWCGERLEEG